MIPDNVRTAISAGRLAHLVTLNADGSPQVTCVWVGIDRDELVTAHLGAYQKVKNVGRDPRVAVSLETGNAGASGLPEYLVVYGPRACCRGWCPRVAATSGGGLHRPGRQVSTRRQCTTGLRAPHHTRAVRRAWTVE